MAERYGAAVQAVRLWPWETEYHLGLAAIHGQFGDFAAAEAEFAAANQLRPNDAQLWAAWGELYAHWGTFEPQQYRQARAAYECTVALAPNVATYHTALGLVLARQGQVEAGVAELERAVDLDATDVVAYQHLANLYLALGRQPDAQWAQRQAVYWVDKTDDD